MSSRLLLLCCMMLQLCGASRVVLQNNGYKNVVVAIDESVSYTTSAQLIPAIKTAFTEASHYIYTATERRAYFRDVRIVVPSSWPPSDEYATAVWETFETAEVRIGNLDQVDQAFTRRSIGLCGRQADYIFSTPGRFTRVDQQSNPAGRMLVHQWAQYRWGVYNEHPTSLWQLYSYMPDGQFEATRCTSDIKGDIVHSEYGGNCHPTTASDECGFRPTSGGDSSQASVMFYQQINEITKFCGSDAAVPHNEEAINDQNVVCNYSSTWDVILNHYDFDGGANLPTSVRLRSSVLTPTFKVVQAQQFEQIVLVLDVSASMQLDGRLDRVRNAAYSLIQIVPVGTQIGIVSFNELAHVNINLTEVRGNQARQLLYDALPTMASGTTSIGSGLQAAVELIKQNNNGAVVGGCSVFVINDGNENADSSITIDSVFNDVVVSGVRIFPITLAISGSTRTDIDTFRKLGNLARQTNGYQYLVPLNIQSQQQTILCESLISACELALQRHRQPIQLLQQSVSVSSSVPVQLNVTVDSHSQASCYFQFTAEKYINELKVEITDPTGSVSDMSSITEVPEFALMTFNVDNAKVGVWKVRLTSSLVSRSIIVAVSIVSHQARITNDPIIVTADVSDRDLSTGTVPVISVAVKAGERGVADAIVIAYVVLPSGETREWNLYDRGANPDHVAADGVYSGYFTDLRKRGEYSVRVAVSATQSSVTVLPSKYVDTVALYYTNRQISEYSEDRRQVAEQFSRVVSGGMFLTEYSQPVDQYPPCRITDLRIVSVNYNTSQITLSWSAPGGNYDRGTIQKYYVKYAVNDPSALRKDFSSQKSLPQSWIVDGTHSILRSQRPAAQMEYLNITVPHRDDVTYYFAVAAENIIGFVGPPSPVVGIALLPLQYPLQINTQDSSSIFSTGVIAAISASCGVALLVLVIILLLCLKRRRRESVKSDDEEKLELTSKKTSNSSTISSNTSGSRKDKRERRAKKKKLAKDDDKEDMIAADVVSQVTDTTYVNTTVSECDLETHQKQHALDNEEMEYQKQVETVQVPTQSKERNEHVVISECDPYTDVKYKTPSVQESKVPEQGTHTYEELSPRAVDPEYDHVQHTNMQQTENQQELIQQLKQPVQTDLQLQIIESETKLSELVDSIKEQPTNLEWEPTSQELQEHLATKEETSKQESTTSEVKGNNSLQQSHDSQNEDTNETEILHHALGEVTQVNITEAGESDNEWKQETCHSSQTDKKESQSETVTSTLQTETNKKAAVLDNTTQLDEGHTAGQVEQQKTLLPNSQSEENTTAAAAADPFTFPIALQSEQPAPAAELHHNKENKTDVNTELAVAGTVVVNDEDEDCIPSVARLVVLSPKEGTPPKDININIEPTVSPGHSEQGSAVEDHYVVSDSPSRLSLDSAEITAIDEVSNEDISPVTATDGDDKVEQSNETSNKAMENRETDSQLVDGDKTTVEQKTDSNIL